MGFIVKSESKYEEAIPLLQKGIATGEPEVNDSRFFFHLGDAFYRTGKHKEVTHLDTLRYPVQIMSPIDLRLICYFYAGI
jgi:hypothetical protein